MPLADIVPVIFWEHLRPTGALPNTHRDNVRGAKRGGHTPYHPLANNVPVFFWELRLMLTLARCMYPPPLIEKPTAAQVAESAR